MKKLFCILCALALLTLSGCSLAKADSVDPGAEILVGAFVSLEPIASLRYQVPVELTKTDDGWQCPGVEGVWVYVLPIDEGGGMRFEPSGDARVDMGGVGTYVGGGMKWRADLTLWNTTEDIVLHFNPLYLRGDGSMYAQPATGLVVDTALTDRFGGWFQSAESAVPVFDWTDQNWSTSVEIFYEVAVPAQRYVLCRMDEENRELSREEYFPGQLPGEVAPDCSWLLLEKHLTDGTVERAAFTPKDDSMVTLQPLENGLCACQTTQLVWGR